MLCATRCVVTDTGTEHHLSAGLAETKAKVQRALRQGLSLGVRRYGGMGLDQQASLCIAAGRARPAATLTNVREAAANAS